MFVYIINNHQKKEYQFNIKQGHNSLTNCEVKIFNNNAASSSINIQNFAFKDQQKITSSQLINGYILDNESSIKVIPAINSSTNSINSSHSVNIGKINEEKIFYLQSRGFDKSHANLLLMNGEISSLKDLHNLPYSLLYKTISKKILNLLKE